MLSWSVSPDLYTERVEECRQLQAKLSRYEEALKTTYGLFDHIVSETNGEGASEYRLHIDTAEMIYKKLGEALGERKALE